MWGISKYFCGARAASSEEQRERLNRVLCARCETEGDTDVYSRYAGAIMILLAPLALVPSLPYILPYALGCLAIAAVNLLCYLRFRRATDRRVAPLVRRSPWKALSPLTVVPTAICIAGAGIFAVDPRFRFGAIVVVISMLVLVAIAWRVAVAPAILFGDDPQLEYQSTNTYASVARAILSRWPARRQRCSWLPYVALPRRCLQDSHILARVTLAVALAYVA